MIRAHGETSKAPFRDNISICKFLQVGEQTDMAALKYVMTVPVRMPSSHFRFAIVISKNFHCLSQTVDPRRKSCKNARLSKLVFCIKEPGMDSPLQAPSLSSRHAYERKRAF
jgi:hypothetical protein